MPCNNFTIEIGPEFANCYSSVEFHKFKINADPNRGIVRRICVSLCDCRYWTQYKYISNIAHNCGTIAAVPFF
jgi:hypothetical protein